MGINMEKEPITSQGLEKIKKELDILKNVKRRDIIQAIAEARAHGDLKENAEYHAAKEEQAKIEGRIIELNDLIARANVIDVTKLEKKDNVIFGSTVELLNLENNEKKTYKIVGKDEADLTKNYIYFRSPIGKALIGKNKKDFITVNTPSGEKNFEIIEVKYI
jgi:transcription elongation factor GreA